MGQQFSTAASTQTPPPLALRLTFGYDETAIRLLKSQRIEKRLPASVTAPPQEGQAGYWFEVRDANNKLVYHRVLDDPLQLSFEVFSDDPEGSIRRVPNPNRRGEFTLVVPDVPNAATLILYGPPLGATSEMERAQELVRYPYAELRR